jgi:phospholipid/cholesterol/gamma-HCH transport system permease protein
VGAVQLEQLGAEIYVADLVGIAVTREMAPIMTAIVLAGRTGAAFAANIGTMQANEEIDALRTLGISAMDFLVLPRMLALILMMPLLTIYADVVGIFGGWLIGVGMLDLSSAAYLQETRAGVGLTNVAIGIVKAAVFGAVVAFAGCLRGLQCGRSAAAVGEAATSAVVTGIVAIIAIDAVFAVVANIMGL